MNEKIRFYRYNGDPEFVNYVNITVSGENKPAVEWIRSLLTEVSPSDMWDSYDNRGKWLDSGGDIKSTVNWRECWQAQQETEAGILAEEESKKKWAVIKAQLAVKKEESS